MSGPTVIDVATGEPMDAGCAKHSPHWLAEAIRTNRRLAGDPPQECQHRQGCPGSDVRDSGDFARDLLGNIAGHMRHIFGSDPAYHELLDALDVLIEQEIGMAEQLIRDRDAGSRVALLRMGAIYALRDAAHDPDIRDNRPWLEWWLTDRADEMAQASNG